MKKILSLVLALVFQASVFGAAANVTVNPAVGGTQGDLNTQIGGSPLTILNLPSGWTLTAKSGSTVDLAAASVILPGSFGAGNVVGPNGATDGNVVLFNGSSGLGIKNSSISGSWFNQSVTSGATPTFGSLTLSGTGNILPRAGASTSRVYFDWANTSGRILVGIEGSAGSQIISGAAAYSAGITSVGSNNVNIGVNQGLVGAFSSTGLAITGRVSASTLVITPRNPEYYGAVGNGSADDTTAITNCINAAGTNGIVIFTAGKSYKTTSQITIPSNGMVLYGYGAIITSTTDSQFQKFKFNANSSGSVLGLTFNCLYTSATTGLSAGVVEIINSQDVVVKDCTFNGVAKNGVYIYGTSERALIQNNYFYQNFCAIFSDDDGANMPTRCRIIGNHIRSGIGLTSTNFSGAIKMSGVGTANSFAQHLIENNIITDPGQVGIEIQTKINQTAINGNTIYGGFLGVSVDDSYNVTVTGNTLKAVENYALETVSGSSGVAFSGNIIDAYNGAGTSITGYGYDIDGGSKITITGGTVNGCDTGIYLQPNGGHTLSEVDVTGVYVSGNDGSSTGFSVKTMTGFTISNCVFDAKSSGMYAWGYFDTTNGPITNGVIQGNRFLGTTAQNGFTLYVPGTNAITQLRVTDNFISGTVGAGGVWDRGSSSLTYLTKFRVFDNTSNSSSVTFNPSTFSGGSSITWPWPYYESEKRYLGMDASGGALGVELPPIANVSEGWEVQVGKTDSSGNAVTLSTADTAKIISDNGSGADTLALASQFKKTTVRVNGTNWIVIQSN